MHICSTEVLAGNLDIANIQLKYVVCQYAVFGMLMQIDGTTHFTCLTHFVSSHYILIDFIDLLPLWS